MIARKIKILFLLGLFYSLNICFADKLEVKLSRNKLSVGETLTVSYYLKNTTTTTSPDFSPLEKDFRILGTHYGKAINVTNGVLQTQTFWQVTVEPKVAGNLLLPPINFGNIKSEEQSLSVTEATDTLSDQQENPAVFVKAEVSNTSPYVQSELLYTFKLFYRSQLENPIFEPPVIKDAMLVPLGEEALYQANIKGQPFYVYEKHFAIFPQKVGKLNIPATHFRASQLNYNPMDAFSIANNTPIQLATPAFFLDVRKPPQNFQAKIWLPAKHIALSEKWSADAAHWETGNPITRMITIEAQGLRADQIPDLEIEEIPGVNVYTDPPQRRNSARGDTVVGTWQQKVTYIPNRAQSFTLPQLRLNWWNRETDTQAIAQLKAVTVNVIEKNANPTLNDNAPFNKEATHTRDLKQANIINNIRSPFYSSIWFWISIFLLSIWLITLVMIFKNKRVKKEKEPIESDGPLHLHAKTLTHACEQGDKLLAQQYLMAWAKSNWQDPPLSLGKLRENVQDEDFKMALANLEQALYADENKPWEGRDLLAAFKKGRKNKKLKGTNKQPSDPLPPLYL